MKSKEEIIRRKEEEKKKYVLVGLWSRRKSLAGHRRSLVESTGWSRRLRVQPCKFGKKILKLPLTFKTLNWSPFFNQKLIGDEGSPHLASRHWRRGDHLSQQCFSDCKI